MTKDYKYIALWLLSTLLITACSNDGADGSGVTNPNEQTSEEIRFNADVWKMAEATRATMYDGGTLSSGSFTVAAYLGNSTDVYFSPTTVNWVTDKWVFQDGKHYWPMSGDLDFFAYMPATKPSYISNFSYTTPRNPQITCTNLPMTYNSASPEAGQGSGLQEFIYAMVTDQNKAGQGESGVELTFAHPFARINMVLSASQAKDITINTITFKGLKNNGSCSFAYNGSSSKWESTWTPSGDATDFKATLDQEFTATGSAQTIGVPYIMIPQNWTGNIEVEATWVDWGVSLKHTLTKQIDAVTWAPGTSYTYTFTITETDLIVNTSKYTEQW